MYWLGQEGMMTKRRKLGEEAGKVEEELRKIREPLNEEILKRRQLAKAVMLRKLPEN
jgi:hypothetical protein